MLCSTINTALLAAAVFYLSSYSIDFVEAFSGANNLFRTPDLLHGRESSSRWAPTHATRLFQGQSIIVQPIVDNRENEMISMEAKGEITPAIQISEVEETVPSSWTQALHRFFIGDIGPPLVVLSISGFLYARLQLSVPFSIAEVTIFASTIVFWWIQEYFFHRVLLHSPVDWIGKSIHQTHHEKNYFHISIDPPALLLGWLFAAHLMMKSILPWHLCLTATVGYALAGLVYEWSHYIVHTKVKPPSTQSNKSFPVSSLSRLFSKMRDNHVRHHLVSDQNWYAFSVPAMDDLFGTNPNVRDVRGDPKKRLVERKKE